jgi:hypothetical protein
MPRRAIEPSFWVRAYPYVTVTTGSSQPFAVEDAADILVMTA